MDRLRATRFALRSEIAGWLGWGSLPDFLIIGGQKAGTTSLYTYLTQHPQVRAPLKKEIHFFDLNHSKGLEWYQSHFPFSVPRRASFVTGESSPYYIFHPLVPKRVRDALPMVKIIVLVRNPVHRAHSHHQHNVRLGLEPLAFEDALDREERVLPGEIERIMAQPGYNSFEHRHFSYLARGRYIDQIEDWLSFFPRKQMLILKSEHLFAEPDRVYSEACDFLGLTSWVPPTWPVANPGQYLSGLRDDTAARLSSYFAPFSARLAQLTGLDLDDWQE